MRPFQNDGYDNGTVVYGLAGLSNKSAVVHHRMVAPKQSPSRRHAADTGLRRQLPMLPFPATGRPATCSRAWRARQMAGLSLSSRRSNSPVLSSRVVSAVDGVETLERQMGVGAFQHGRTLAEQGCQSSGRNHADGLAQLLADPRDRPLDHADVSPKDPGAHCLYRRLADDAFWPTDRDPRQLGGCPVQPPQRQIDTRRNGAAQIVPV